MFREGAYNPKEEITTKSKNPEKERDFELTDRMAKVERLRQELLGTADAENKGIDPGIFETVLYLNALDLPTTQSCEGHAEEGRGRPFPWVRFEAPDEPHERFVGETDAYQRAADEAGVLVEQLRQGKPDDAYWQLHREISQYEETPEFQRWMKKNLELHEKVTNLLNEFYQSREVPPDTCLVVEDSSGLNFEVHSNEENSKKFAWHEAAPEELAAAREKLPRRREELVAFTEFLKHKYLS